MCPEQAGGTQGRRFHLLFLTLIPLLSGLRESPLMACLVFHISAKLASENCQLRIHGWNIVDSFSYRTFGRHEERACLGEGQRRRGPCHRKTIERLSV